MFRTWLARLRRKRLRDRAQSQVMRDYLDAQWPDGARPWQQADMLALDLETTGLDARSHEIVSFGWVLIEQGRILLDSCRHLIVQADIPMNQSAVIHGIFDSHMDEGVLLEHALSKLLEELKGRVLVLHHAPMDLGFLQQACLEFHGVKLVVPVIDTMALEQRRLRRRDIPIKPGMLRLGEIRERYGLCQYRAHNALTDAMATAELLLAITAHATASDNKLPLKRLLSAAF